jgi:hypothetical protein
LSVESTLCLGGEEGRRREGDAAPKGPLLLPLPSDPLPMGKPRQKVAHRASDGMQTLSGASSAEGNDTAAA